MGARILDLASERVRRRSGGTEPMVRPGAAAFGGRFHFWRGASGRSYVHTVYSLRECPQLPQACIVLVQRDDAGRRTALRVLSVGHAAPSLNLADVRRSGAELGANEVHVHLLAPSGEALRLVEFDLASALFDMLPPANANDSAAPRH